ncbi:MAG: DUF4912 domain-containing protein [Treponema sp.]|nr:DUF4912 domain-containing protein [Treponema sp.]
MLYRKIAEYKIYLNSLTTRDLIKLADRAGIDIPPDLDRTFIIRELLESRIDNDNDNDNDNVLEFLDEKSSLATAELPRQYHITYLEILPRDPQWVFVFWEIKAQVREHFERDPRFEGYALKAYVRKCSENTFVESFTVPVKKEDNSRYLGFPNGGIFRIALWVQGIETSLIVSRIFSLPRFLNNPENDEYLTRPLIRLSGAADFSVLRDAEKIPRSRL